MFLNKAEPIKAMEDSIMTVAVDPLTGIVYQTEDHGLILRYIRRIKTIIERWCASGFGCRRPTRLRYT